MLNVKFHGLLLQKTDLEFENEGVLNPSCIQKNGVTHMFYRAVKKGNYSSIGYCQIDKDKVLHRNQAPLLIPEHDYEIHGLEDPRVVELDGIFYLFYTAYDGKNARSAFATSTDLIHFEKHGLITPSITYEQAGRLFLASGMPENYKWYMHHYQDAIAPDVLFWDKDLVLFPEKINNKFLLFYRVMPGVQYMLLDNLLQLGSEDFWAEQLQHLNTHVVMNPEFWYETRKIGASCIPIKTRHGWLLIYHGVEDSSQGRIYRASAALLDLKEPWKVIGRLPEPLFSPHQEWEKFGVANNVVFPSSAILYGEDLYIYYGAADTSIAVASVNLSELIDQLIINKNI